MTCPAHLNPTNQPKPTAAHKRLEIFIGNWHAEGTSYGDGQDATDPRASSVPWTSDESYEWLPGSFFVLHRWDAQLGKHEFKGDEVMGYDEAEGGYFMHQLGSDPAATAKAPLSKSYESPRLFLLAQA